MTEIWQGVPDPLKQACVAAMVKIGEKVFGGAWETLGHKEPEQVLARVCRTWRGRSAADVGPLSRAFQSFFTSDAWQKAQRQILNGQYVEVDFDELGRELNDVCERGGWAPPEGGAAPDLAMVVEDLRDWLRDTPEFQVRWQQPLQDTIRAVSGPEAAEANHSLARRKYLKSVVQEHSYVRFMGTAETGGPTEIGIRQVYVVPRLEGREQPAEEAAWWRMRAPRQRKDTGTPERNELFPASRIVAAEAAPDRTVILGAPGSGKSTIGQWAALTLAADQFASGPNPTDGIGLLPVFYRFRDLARDMSEVSKTVKAPTLWDCLHRRASQLVGLTMPAGFFRRMDEKHGLFVFFDGLDEAVRQQDAVSLVSGFADGLAPHSRVVVTSRPFEYRHPLDPSVYRHYRLSEFDDEEIKTFIDRWRKAREADSTEAQRRADQLWQSVQEKSDIHDMARNALLLTMIVRVHFWMGELPDSRVELYAKCADTLLKHWTEAAGLEKGPLDRDEKTLFLAELAFSMQDEAGGRLREGENTLVITESKLRQKLREFLKREKPGTSADSVVERLQGRDAILVDNGEGQFGFIHRSFQEYFASWWMKEEFDSRKLKHYLDKTGWRETLILAVAQLDSRTRRRLLVELAGENYVPLAVECVKAGKKVDRWLDVLVRFLSKYYEEVEENLDISVAECAAASGDRLETVEILTALFERETREGRSLAAAVELAEALDGQVPALAKLLEDFWSESGEREPGTQRDMVEVQARPGRHGKFLIDKYLVTNERFERMIPARKAARENDEYSSTDDQPVIYVNWWEARLYCRWRGKGFRLPDETEWYSAAAWDRETDKERNYPWEGSFDSKKCNTSESGIGKTTPVKKFEEGHSAVGCYNMAGNVWEWLENDYDDREGNKVIRGGSWSNSRNLAARVFRYFSPPHDRGYNVGFRCARTFRGFAPRARTAGRAGFTEAARVRGDVQTAGPALRSHSGRRRRARSPAAGLEWAGGRNLSWPKVHRRVCGPSPGRTSALIPP